MPRMSVDMKSCIITIDAYFDTQSFYRIRAFETAHIPN
jgi:hypothetical protein